MGITGVYYDTTRQRFFEVRSDILRVETLLCGDFCRYYEDTKTATVTQKLPRSCLLGCIKITEENIDKHPKLWGHKKLTGINFWKVVE